MSAGGRAARYLPFAPAFFASVEVVLPITLPFKYAVAIGLPAALLCLAIALFRRRPGSPRLAAGSVLIGVGLLAAYHGLASQWLYRNKYHEFRRSVIGSRLTEYGERVLREIYEGNLRNLHESLDAELWDDYYDVRSQLGVVAVLGLLYVGSFASLAYGFGFVTERGRQTSRAAPTPASGDSPRPDRGRSDFTVFISYAREDNEHEDRSRRWLDRLLEHIQPLVLQKQVSIWADTEVEAGEQWHGEIQAQLQNAKVAVLLISPAFLASRYIRESELPVLLMKAKQKGLTVLPVILRHSLYHETKFKYPDPTHGPEEVSLFIFQAINPPERPLNMMEEHEQDQLLVSVAQRILSIVGTGS